MEESVTTIDIKGFRVGLRPEPEHGVIEVLFTSGDYTVFFFSPGFASLRFGLGLRYKQVEGWLFFDDEHLTGMVERIQAIIRVVQLAEGAKR